MTHVVSGDAERMIRNGVTMRKNSYCNRSAEGAKTQANLMSMLQWHIIDRQREKPQRSF